MGTRSLTVFIEEGGEEIAVLYRQMDGHIESHGKELADFLAPFGIVNGLRGDNSKTANGMGCLAAQVVAHFKDEPGQFYLHAAGTRDCGEEYIYTVHLPPGAKRGVQDRFAVWIKVQAGSMTMFGMPGTKQANMPVLYDGPADEYDVEKIKAADEKAHEEGIKNDFLDEQKAKEAKA